jgi:hypothetical protein
VFIVGAYTSFAQQDEEPCKLMLQNGLYKTFNFVRTSNFSQDLKTYFSSDQFKSDFKSSKWTGGISVVIEAVPISLNAGASDTEIDQFQSRVRSSTSLKVEQAFYDYALTTVPDVELARQYTECIEKSRKFGFKLYPTINDQDVSFVISYRKEFDADAMPKLLRLAVINASNVVSTAVVGQPITNNPVITANRDANKDLTLIFETDKGVVTYKVPSEAPGFNKDFPVGTIITSYLNWTEFQNITQNNATNPAGLFWTSRYSKWAPADGRPVPNSKFVTAASQLNIPDLRGMFMRGLNSFDSDEIAAVDPNRKDPDSRSRGSFQSDGFKSHNHGGRTGNDSPDHTHFLPGYKFNASYGGQNSQWLGRPNNGNDYHTDGASTRHQHDISSEGGNETRPKNVAIYYYIRIN